jgi:hypothetical protein
VTGDFTMEEYIAVHRLVYRVSEAVREEVGAERMYIFTYGSNQGNSHVHWHVVPLPPGTPYEDQQVAWASWGMGVLRIPQEVMASLAARIGRRVEKKRDRPLPAPRGSRHGHRLRLCGTRTIGRGLTCRANPGSHPAVIDAN